jgi:hypothetical protein
VDLSGGVGGESLGRGERKRGRKGGRICWEWWMRWWRRR